MNEVPTQEWRAWQHVYAVDTTRPGDGRATRDRLVGVRYFSSAPIDQNILQARLAAFYDQNNRTPGARFTRHMAGQEANMPRDVRIPEPIIQGRYRAPSQHIGGDEPIESRNARIAHQNSILASRHPSIPRIGCGDSVIDRNNQRAFSDPVQERRSEPNQHTLGSHRLDRVRKWLRDRLNLGVAERDIPQSRYGPGVGSLRHRHTYTNEVMLVDDFGNVQRDHSQNYTPQTGEVILHLESPIHLENDLQAGGNYVSDDGSSTAVESQSSADAPSGSQTYTDYSTNTDHSDVAAWVQEIFRNEGARLPSYPDSDHAREDCDGNSDHGSTCDDGLGRQHSNHGGFDDKDAGQGYLGKEYFNDGNSTDRESEHSSQDNILPSLWDF